ncbi:unnamed protein product, partial [Chrysoparadoxa australica]
VGAKEGFHKILQTNSPHTPARMNALVMLELKLGKLEDARETLSVGANGFRGSSQSMLAYICTIEAFAEAGRYQEAMDMFDEARQIDTI